MWVVRELLRLLIRIVCATAIAIIVAGVWAFVAGGDFSRAMRVMLLLLGCILILIAGAGNRTSAASRSAMDWRVFAGIRGRLSPAVAARPGQPTLTASAVFIGSGAVLILLGVIV
jgi:hypothetical protein